MAITHPGDLYTLGRHRLLCGDARKKGDLLRLLNGTEVDLVLTDPPYGIKIVDEKKAKRGQEERIGRVGGGCIIPSKIYKQIEGDEEPFDPGPLLRIGKNQIIFGAIYFASRLPERSCWIVWDKREGVLRNDFADCELAWTSFNKPARIYRQLWCGLIRKGNRRDELKARVHPAQKPVGVFARILEDFSRPGEVVLDPYLGSGTTLISCEKTGRVCYGMEIETEYCDLIIKRFAEYTGIPEEKIRETREEIKGGDDGNI